MELDFHIGHHKDQGHGSDMQNAPLKTQVKDTDTFQADGASSSAH